MLLLLARQARPLYETISHEVRSGQMGFVFGYLDHFYRYMKRRCVFLDNLPGFYLNSGEGEFKESMPGVQITTNTMFLGSTLMEAMLKEVRHFCDSNITSPEQVRHMVIINTEFTALS